MVGVGLRHRGRYGPVREGISVRSGPSATGTHHVDVANTITGLDLIASAIMDETSLSEAVSFEALVNTLRAPA